MHETTKEAPTKGKSRGHMFLVDVPTYAAVCDLGDPDAAAVYLILGGWNRDGQPHQHLVTRSSQQAHRP
jgi:hypothetical protein